jgi:hypothetical protein
VNLRKPSFFAGTIAKKSIEKTDLLLLQFHCLFLLEKKTFIEAPTQTLFNYLPELKKSC